MNGRYLDLASLLLTAMVLMTLIHAHVSPYMFSIFGPMIYEKALFPDLITVDFQTLAQPPNNALMGIVKNGVWYSCLYSTESSVDALIGLQSGVCAFTVLIPKSAFDNPYIAESAKTWMSVSNTASIALFAMLVLEMFIVSVLLLSGIAFYVSGPKNRYALKQLSASLVWTLTGLTHLAIIAILALRSALMSSHMSLKYSPSYGLWALYISTLFVMVQIISHWKWYLTTCKRQSNASQTHIPVHRQDSTKKSTRIFERIQDTFKKSNRRHTHITLNRYFFRPTNIQVVEDERLYHH